MSRVNNKEKYKEYDHNYYIKHKRPKSKIGQAELKIADLEAKLAEKENEIKTLICDYESRITKTHELMSWLEHEKEELKQQLEEKDKEIERLNHKLNIEEPCLIRNYKDMLEQLIQSHTQLEQEIEKLKQQYTILENENGKLTTELIMGKYKKAQKEVSFGKQLAIQELEKVKNFVKNANGIIGFDWRIDRFKVIETIDNQIKVLKGE